MSRPRLTGNEWDRVPQDLKVEEIFGRLDSGSRASCKAVCREWNRLASSNRPPMFEVPWLWDSFLVGRQGRIYMDLPENRIYIARFPDDFLKAVARDNFRCRCLGSFGPWLLLVFQQKFNWSFLYNPMTSKHIFLPALSLLDDDVDFMEGRLSCTPDEGNLTANKCTVAIFSYSDIYICKPYEKEWTKVEFSFGDDTIGDAVFNYGVDGRLQLFVIDNEASLRAFDVVGNTVVPTTLGASSRIVWDSHRPTTGYDVQFNLVVNNSTRELYVLDKHDPSGEQLRYIINVHKLNNGRLVYVTDLDGGMIFLGEIYSCFCSGPPPPGTFFRKDCVYNPEMDDDDFTFYELCRYPMNKPRSRYEAPAIYKLGVAHSPLWFIPTITVVQPQDQELVQPQDQELGLV